MFRSACFPVNPVLQTMIGLSWHWSARHFGKKIFFRPLQTEIQFSEQSRYFKTIFKKNVITSRFVSSQRTDDDVTKCRKGSHFLLIIFPWAVFWKSLTRKLFPRGHKIRNISTSKSDRIFYFFSVGHFRRAMFLSTMPHDACYKEKLTLIRK